MNYGIGINNYESELVELLGGLKVLKDESGKECND